MRVFRPPWRSVTVVEIGPEPVGANMVERLDALYGLAAWGVVDLSPPAFGPTGDPTRTFAGDLGPLQGAARALLTTGARHAVAEGERTGLPITKVPSRTLANSDIFSVQSQFGVRG